MGNQDLKAFVRKKTGRKANVGKKLILQELKTLARSFKKLQSLCKKYL